MASIGLVLSGGMAKGAFQVGALRAISEFFTPQEFCVISSSSVGALNAFAFSVGHLDQAEDLWKNLCGTDDNLFIGKVLRSSALQQGIYNICSETDAIPTKCYTTLFDYSKRQVKYINLQQAAKEEHANFLRASVAMPFYNRPVKIGKHSYFDGAMIDNIPVFPLLSQPPDYIFCIYFDEYSYIFENPQFDQRVIKITLPAKKRLKDSVIFRKEAIVGMMDDGYEKTSLLLQMLLSKGKDDLEYIYHYISCLKQKEASPQLRITGDVLVTNLNRIARKLTKRKLE